MPLGRSIRRGTTGAGFALLAALTLTPGLAQETGGKVVTSTGPSTPEPPAEGQKPAGSAPGTQPLPEPPGGTHVLGVLPNYRTVNATDVKGALTPRQKLTIASKDSFDYPLVLLSAGLAGIGQWSNSDPSYGQGMEGYAKRLGAAYGNQAIGNLMTEGFFPVFLHEDPRYYRRGTGPAWSRTGYALSRIFVTHTDSGTVRFNYSEWLGNAAATAISNIYTPDERTAGSNATTLVEQCGIDAASQVIKEFWPDVKQKFFERHHGAQLEH